MIALHAAVLLFGAAALVAQSSSLSPLALTLARCLIAAPLLLGLAFARGKPRVGWPGLRHALGAGALLALHWVAFFHAMRGGGIPLALLSYAAFPAFSLLLEHIDPPQPSSTTSFTLRRGLQLALVLAGLLLLASTGSGQARSGLVKALAWGLLAGASFALLAHWNARLRRRYSAVQLTAGQLAGAALWLLPWGLPQLALAQAGDWRMLLILGLVCTALGHGLFQHALGSVSPFQAGVAAALEPAYGMILAALVGMSIRPQEWLALPVILTAALLGVPRKSTRAEASGSSCPTDARRTPPS